MKKLSTPRTVSKIRELIGTLFVISLAVFAMVSATNQLNLIKYISGAFQTGKWLNISVYRYGEKLDCLASDISSHDTVGFVADFNRTQNIEYYQLAQYFLVPTLVDFSIERPYVIGYAPKPEYLESILITYPNLLIIQDCDNGIFLFTNEP